jgi:hypothetical protein
MTVNNRKQLPLCKKHHREFDSGKFSELDNNYLSGLYRKKISDSKTLNFVLSTGSFDKNN